MWSDWSTPAACEVPEPPAESAPLAPVTRATLTLAPVTRATLTLAPVTRATLTLEP